MAYDVLYSDSTAREVSVLVTSADTVLPKLLTVTHGYLLWSSDYEKSQAENKSPRQPIKPCAICFVYCPHHYPPL
eukprot:4241115-Amphidinium_carterae.2